MFKADKWLKGHTVGGGHGWMNSVILNTICPLFLLLLIWVSMTRKINDQHTILMSRKLSFSHITWRVSVFLLEMMKKYIQKLNSMIFEGIKALTQCINHKFSGVMLCCYFFPLVIVILGKKKESVYMSKESSIFFKGCY